MLELASIIILGIFAQWVAWKIKVPAILPLILIGLSVGPLSTLFTESGEKLINPIYIDGHGLFPGKSLFYFVSLAIGIILFEGGLTLKLREVKEVGPSIVRLISLGSLITFIGAGLAAHFIMGLPWTIDFLFAGLIIVTGPTVIAPILQNVPLNRNVAAVLKWEGILIDPIGALVAVLVFEFIRSAGTGMEYTSHAFMTFLQIILIGGTLGAIAGYGLFQIVKKNLVPHYLLNVFILAYVLAVFVLSDELAHESGLLAVVVMGLSMANLDVPHIKEILSFKESLSVLLISILFILLAANMNMDELELLIKDWRPITLFAVVVLAVRPLGVFLSTRGSNLTLQEKLFISWVGPRGIVAAGIASLFGLTLAAEQIEGSEYITPLVFMVVLGTVLLNATTARLVARLLGVIQDTSSGVLIVGAQDFTISLGTYLKERGRNVFFVDSNQRNIEKARDAGMHGIIANIYVDDLAEEYELLEVGSILAMTGSAEVNEYAITRYKSNFGENGAYRLISGDELKQRKTPEDGHVFSYTDDYINISEAHREGSVIREEIVKGTENFRETLQRMREEKYCVPLFLRHPNDKLNTIPADVSEMELEEDQEYGIVFLGARKG
ncbi:cell shape-determining protein [Lewinellaceae bacterium SD302]|nr:cell shape-determining protein [Lewinellaceae bacterium SD302]